MLSATARNTLIVPLHLPQQPNADTPSKSAHPGRAPYPQELSANVRAQHAQEAPSGHPTTRISIEQIPAHDHPSANGNAGPAPFLLFLNSNQSSHEGESNTLPLPIVAPPQLRPRTRSIMQRILHPFTRATPLELAAKAERKEVKSVIKELQKMDVAQLYRDAFKTAAALYARDYQGDSLTSEDFARATHAGIFLRNESVAIDKRRHLNGKIDKNPWIPLELIASLCAETGVSPPKTGRIWSCLAASGVAQRALEPDLSSTSPELIVVTRLLVDPPFLTPKSRHK